MCYKYLRLSTHISEPLNVTQDFCQLKTCVKAKFLLVVTLKVFESVAWFAFREGKGSAREKVLEWLRSVFSAAERLHLFQS